MKYVFAAIFSLLVVLSVVARAIRPKPPGEGKIPLTWVSDDNPARRQQIDLFNQLHPDHHLTLDPNNTGMQKVIVQCIGGVGPDIFDCYNAFQLSAYVKSGIAWDLTEKFAEAGIDVATECWAAGLPIMVYEGRVYGFLNNASVNAIWINKGIFDDCGIPYPKPDPKTGWTWDEFLPLARRLTVRDAKGRVKHFGLMMDWWGWNHFVNQWGGRVYSPDGTRCVLDCPETIAAIQFMQDLIYKHKVSPDPVQEAAMRSAGGWGSGTITFFGGGKAAMALGGRWWLCTLRKYEKLRLGAVESPHGPHRHFWAYGRTSLINKNGPRREEAFAFLKYLASREFSELINHQADALAPVKKHCYTDLYLRDPEFPDEDFNAMWRDIVEYGSPSEDSPFVNGNVAGRILNKQLDLVKSNEKDAAAAMRDAARLINAEIHKTLDRVPSLRKRYGALVAGRGAAD